MALVTDYTALVTTEHAGKPKFMAMVGAVAQGFVDQINLLLSLPSAFDLDYAIGAQLDAVGVRAGISRTLKVPISGVYFGFDTAGIGFDEGLWKGPFDPDEGISSLDDDTYRLLIRAKIGANQWDGTLSTTAAILAFIFPSNIITGYVTTADGSMLAALDPSSGDIVPVITEDDQSTYVFIQDNGDMSITYGISGVRPSALFLALLTGGYLPLKPESVRITDYLFTSLTGSPIFGFDASTDYIGGFDIGAWAIPA